MWRTHSCVPSSRHLAEHAALRRCWSSALRRLPKCNVAHALMRAVSLIVQLFQKVPALKELAPTQSEPPFQIAQLLTLIVFVVLIVRAVIKFRPLRAS